MNNEPQILDKRNLEPQPVYCSFCLAVFSFVTRKWCVWFFTVHQCIFLKFLFLFFFSFLLSFLFLRQVLTT